MEAIQCLFMSGLLIQPFWDLPILWILSSSLQGLVTLHPSPSKVLWFWTRLYRFHHYSHLMITEAIMYALWQVTLEVTLDLCISTAFCQLWKTATLQITFIIHDLSWMAFFASFPQVLEYYSIQPWFCIVMQWFIFWNGTMLICN